MNIDAIFKQRKKRWNNLVDIRKNGPKKMITCKGCGESFDEAELRKNHFICPDCGQYLTMNVAERIHMLADEDTFVPLNENLQTRNPLAFPGYEEKINANMEKTGYKDAILTGICSIEGQKTAIGILNSEFLMGSMGTVVGEKIVRLTEYAMKKKLPLIIYSASGGARMQEGLHSLMQMARTSGAVQRFKDAGGLFISVFTNPTTGGVSASFASLGDINIGEPGALICFAGPRVIEQTIGQKLPEGFQRAEFLEEHGMLDLILERKDQKRVLGQLLKMHQKKGYRYDR